jgi:4-diphosphocytidyl-2-C-methyl-D-erythritol kinase
MSVIHTLAPAKINVFLRIIGCRPDGYHLLDSLMIPINLHDEIRIEADDQKSTQERESQFVLTCDDSSIPTDATNLVHKAAGLLLREAKVQARVAIHLRKRIPAGAGLGGGSSDAAATLKGLNALLELGFSDEHLCQFGARLGADVPFFIPCRPARVEGIGEILTPIPPLPHRWLVLVAPPFGVSTPWAYKAFDKLPPLGIPTSPQSIAPHQWPSQEFLVNDLERAVFLGYPQIAAIKSAMLHYAEEGALMSGSGSSVFGIFRDRMLAEQAAAMLESHGKTFLGEPLLKPPFLS